MPLAQTILNESELNRTTQASYVVWAAFLIRYYYDRYALLHVDYYTESNGVMVAAKSKEVQWKKLFQRQKCGRRIVLRLLLLMLTSVSSFAPSGHQGGVAQQDFRLLSTKDEHAIDVKRVAIIGSGAVGSYYGARLYEAGHNVCFYMRQPHYAACLRNGLNITSIAGDMAIPPDKINLYDNTKSIGPVDWVIVCLKSTALDAIPDLIYPCLSKDTRVLAIMNGLIEDDLICMLKERAGEPKDARVPLQCCRALYGGKCSMLIFRL